MAVLLIALALSPATLHGGLGPASAQVPAEPPVGPPSESAPQAPLPETPPDQTRPAAPKDAPANPEPDTPDKRAKLLDDLYKRLAAAETAETAEQVALAIQRLWRLSGSPTADLLLERAEAATRENRQGLALELLDTVVDLQPDFAAAWNQRAFVFYLKSDYQRALGDLRRALALEPNHFMALDGLARILREIGEKKGALAAYRSLVAVHPHAPGAQAAIEELKVEVEGQGI